MALKILLADDSMTAQNMGRKILTDAGYDVTAVSNGAVAVKKMTEVKPDIVLLDVYMPGYSGLEVCRKIKGSLLTGKIPVLLTVGKLEPFRAEDAMKAKADGFIIKPFEASDLIAVVKVLAERIRPKTQARPAFPEEEAYTSDDTLSSRVELPRELAATPAFSEEFFPPEIPVASPADIPNSALQELRERIDAIAEKPPAKEDQSQATKDATIPEPGPGPTQEPAAETATAMEEVLPSTEKKASLAPAAPQELPVPHVDREVKFAAPSPSESPAPAISNRAVPLAEPLAPPPAPPAKEAEPPFWRRILRRAEPVSLGLQAVPQAEASNLPTVVAAAGPIGEEPLVALEASTEQAATTAPESVLEPKLAPAEVPQAEPAAKISVTPPEIPEAAPESAEVSFEPAVTPEVVEPLAASQPEASEPPSLAVLEPEAVNGPAIPIETALAAREMATEELEQAPALDQSVMPPDAGSTSIFAELRENEIEAILEPISAQHEVAPVPVAESLEVPGQGESITAFAPPEKSEEPPAPEVAAPIVAVAGTPVEAPTVALTQERPEPRVEPAPELEAAPTPEAPEVAMPERVESTVETISPAAEQPTGTPEKFLWRKILRRAAPVSPGMEDTAPLESSPLPPDAEIETRVTAEIEQAPALDLSEMPPDAGSGSIFAESRENEIEAILKPISAQHEVAPAPVSELLEVPGQVESITAFAAPEKSEEPPAPEVAAPIVAVGGTPVEAHTESLTQERPETRVEPAPELEVPPVPEAPEVAMPERAESTVESIAPAAEQPPGTPDKFLWRRILRRAEPVSPGLEETAPLESSPVPPVAELEAQVTAELDQAPALDQSVMPPDAGSASILAELRENEIEAILEPISAQHEVAPAPIAESLEVPGQGESITVSAPPEKSAETPAFEGAVQIEATEETPIEVASVEAPTEALTQARPETRVEPAPELEAAPTPEAPEVAMAERVESTVESIAPAAEQPSEAPEKFLWRRILRRAEPVSPGLGETAPLESTPLPPLAELETRVTAELEQAPALDQSVMPPEAAPTSIFAELQESEIEAILEPISAQHEVAAAPVAELLEAPAQAESITASAPPEKSAETPASEDAAQIGATEETRIEVASVQAPTMALTQEGPEASMEPAREIEVAPAPEAPEVATEQRVSPASPAILDPEAALQAALPVEPVVEIPAIQTGSFESPPSSQPEARESESPSMVEGESVGEPPILAEVEPEKPVAIAEIASIVQVAGELVGSSEPAPAGVFAELQENEIEAIPEPIASHREEIAVSVGELAAPVTAAVPQATEPEGEHLVASAPPAKQETELPIAAEEVRTAPVSKGPEPPTTPLPAEYAPVTEEQESAPPFWKRFFRRAEPISLELTPPVPPLSLESPNIPAEPIRPQKEPVVAPVELALQVPFISDMVAKPGAEPPPLPIAWGALASATLSAGEAVRQPLAEGAVAPDSIGAALAGEQLEAITGGARKVQIAAAALSFPTRPGEEEIESAEPESFPRIREAEPTVETEARLPDVPAKDRETAPTQDVPPPPSAPVRTPPPEAPRRQRKSEDYPHFVPLKPESGRAPVAFLAPEPVRTPAKRPEPERPRSGSGGPPAERPHFVPFFKRDERSEPAPEAKPAAGELRLPDEFGLPRFRVSREKVVEAMTEFKPAAPPPDATAATGPAQSAPQQDELALQIVDRVFQNLRPALMEEVKRLLREKEPE